MSKGAAVVFVAMLTVIVLVGFVVAIAIVEYGWKALATGAALPFVYWLLVFMWHQWWEKARQESP